MNKLNIQYKKPEKAQAKDNKDKNKNDTINNV